METHITVLREEALEALAITREKTIVDATLGSCGHATGILEHLGSKGIFIGIDADPDAIRNAEKVLQGEAKQYLRVGNFRNINSILDSIGIQEVDGILADLGWRIEQFKGNGRGFSFLVDEPLIMTFGDPTEYPFVARDIVNEWSVGDIHNVLKGYGEERYSRRIAQAICHAREQTPINTTFDLVRVIEGAVPSQYRFGKLHPATRTFQALRIAVNDELDALGLLITHAIERLAPHGRLAIISFHSLEDRIVKHQFRALSNDGYGEVLTKKPITPRSEELLSNPRARSAKLRVFKRT